MVKVYAKCFPIDENESRDQYLEERLNKWLAKANIAPEQIVSVTQSGSGKSGVLTVLYSVSDTPGQA